MAPNQRKSMKTPDLLHSANPLGPDNNLSYTPEISLMTFIGFIKYAWRLIIFAGMCGLAISVIYLCLAPRQYEAVAQIAMATIGNVNAKDSVSLSPLGVTIEEPALLISRLSSPTSFPSQVQISCGLEGKEDDASHLVKAVKITQPKGVANVVELKTTGGTSEIATACAVAIFQLIKTTQAQILKPYVEEARIKLQDDELRLQTAKSLVAKADKSGEIIGATYLSTRDEIRYLLDEISMLKNVVVSSENRASRLIAPIYSNNAPIAPRKINTLVGGAFGGVFLGFLLALLRQSWKKKSVNSGLNGE